MPVCGYEQLVQCPYEKSHLVTPDKLITHLTKCRKQHLKKYPIPTIVVCPFNSTHHVRQEELDNHVKDCDARDLSTHMLSGGLMEVTSNGKQDWPDTNGKIEHFTANAYPKEVPEKQNVLTPEDEDWETQQIRTPYDPAKRILECEVIRKPVGLSKAERKEFCAAERERRRFLAARREEKELQSECGIGQGEFTSNFVSTCPSTSQKYLYNSTSDVMQSDEKNDLEEQTMLRRPKVVATPTRAISTAISKTEETVDCIQQPSLRRPKHVMTPTKNLLEKVVSSANEGGNGEKDHYEKFLEEKMKEIKM